MTVNTPPASAPARDLRQLQNEISPSGGGSAERFLEETRIHLRDAANAAEREPAWYERQAKELYAARAFRSIDAALTVADEFTTARLRRVRARLGNIVNGTAAAA